MQVTIFIALMASLVLASPIGRYRDHVLRPRYPQQGAPYANSTSSTSVSVSATSVVASELIFIIPSTSITASQPFSSAVVPSRSFQNVKDGVPVSTPGVATLTTITLTKTVGVPVKTTQKLSTSTSIPKVTSSASRKSFEHPSNAANLTSVVVVPGTSVIASPTILTSSISDVVEIPSASSIAVPDKTPTASTVTGSTSDAVVTPSASSIAVPDKTLTASTATGSTSDAVVTPSTLSIAVPDKTLTASAATGSTSDAVVTPSASSIAVPDNTLTASAITGSTSDAVVTPSSSPIAVPDNTLTATTITGSTSDAVVTPSSSPIAVPDDTLTTSAIAGSAVVTPLTSDTMSTVKYEPTSGLLSSVRYPVGTKPVTLSKPATTSAAIITSEPIAISKPATTSTAVVTSEPIAISKPATTSATIITSEPIAISKPATTSAAVVTSKSATTSATIVTSESVATSKPATTSAAIVTSEPVATSAAIVTSEPAVTSGPVTPTVSASQQSTATKSTEASPSAIADDKFGNKQLAITENKGFSTLTSTSKCDPAKMSTQNACIGGAFAQCGSNGVYIIVSPCSAPTKCFSMPLELSAGTSVGCTTPDDAAYRMGLASAAELVTLISRRHVDDEAPAGLAPTSAALPVAASTAISSASQEPKIPVPSGLKTSEARSPTSTKACVSSAPVLTTATSIDTPHPTAVVSSASQEPKIPVPSGLKTSEVGSPIPTTESGGFASSAPILTATIDTSLPAKATAAVSSVSQEPKLPIPSGLLTSEVRLPPTSTVVPSITSAPVPGPSTVTVTVATTFTIKG